MERCASAHYWARELRGFGHEVRLIPAQHVKACVHGNKNDYNDARAIGEAAGRSDIRAVSVKTVEQQDVQTLYRLRAARVKERTALCNQVRGLLGEYGIVLAQGVGTVRRGVPEVLKDWVIAAVDRRVSREEPPNVLAGIAENTTAVWDWAPQGTPVRGCLVLGGERRPTRTQYDYGKGPVVSHTPATLGRELKAEAVLPRELDECVANAVAELGPVSG